MNKHVADNLILKDKHDIDILYGKWHLIKYIHVCLIQYEQTL